MRISDWSSDVCSSDLASSAFIAQFRDIDVEVANLIFLELLRLLPIGFGQPTDPVALQATVQRRACQVWDHVLPRDEHVVERQSRLHRTPDVFEVLERGCAQVGYPASVRSDNGSEFYLPRARSVGLHEGRDARLLAAWQAHRQRVHRELQRQGMP